MNFIFIGCRENIIVYNVYILYNILIYCYNYEKVKIYFS